MRPAAPPRFSYHRPSTVEEAVEALGAEGAAALAGGTDVVPLRAAGAIAPLHLVDVKHLPELRGIERANGTLSIGAATPLTRIGADGANGTLTIGAATPLAPIGTDDDPALAAVADGARIVGAPQTRARGTIGGNVCRSSPAGDTLPGLLVLEAEALLRGPEGERRVPLTEFFTGPGRNVRAAGELLTRLELPRLEGGSAYARFTYRRSMDLAVAGVAARVQLAPDGGCVAAAVAIGAVAPTPRLVPEAAEALVGTPVDAAAIDAACAAVVSAATPIDDVRGARRHRLRVLRPLARGVLETASGRARSLGEATTLAN